MKLSKKDSFHEVCIPIYLHFKTCDIKFDYFRHEVLEGFFREML